MTIRTRVKLLVAFAAGAAAVLLLGRGGGSVAPSEAATPANQGKEQQQRDRRLLEVEAFRKMRHGRRDDHHDRELPRAPLPLGQRARQPDQAEREGDGEDAGRLGPPGRQEAAGDPHTVRHLRRQRRDEADQADERGSQRQQLLRPGQT